MLHASCNLISPLVGKKDVLKSNLISTTEFSLAVPQRLKQVY